MPIQTLLYSVSCGGVVRKRHRTGTGQTIQKKSISYLTAGKMKLIYYPASVKPDRFVLCSGNYIGEGERVQCGRGYL